MRVVTARGALVIAAAASSLLGCGDSAARVTLVNTSGGCGRPAAPTELRIIAYARDGEAVRSVDPDGDTVDIADFPADTEQIGVEVLVGGGAVAAVGKSAPLDFRALPDSAQIAIFMAPIDDFCPAAAMSEARAAPLVARIATGVLVVGGIGANGMPLGTAERYDRVSNSFVPVAVPDGLAQDGFVGTQLASMPDGRVAVTGGQPAVIAVYDPATDRFDDPKLLAGGRVFHGAIAIDATHVLTAGGCSDLAGSACSGEARKDSHAYDVDAPGSDNAPRAMLAAGRIGATVIDAGVQRTGQRAFVAAGGTAAPGAADPTAADRFALDAPIAESIGNTFAQPALLDGGGVLTAFAADGAVPSGAASVIAPDVTTARNIAAAASRGGMRLVTLEDGRVLAFGGEQSDVLRYAPTLDAWETLAYGPSTQRPGALTAPRLVRLDDGAVLVLGGTAAGQPSASAWIYRPPLLGPAAGSVTVQPADPRATVLTPVDPAAVSRADGWTLTAPAGELARAIVGGPRTADGSVRAIVRVRSGGVALVAQQESPAQAIIGELAPGAPARIVRLDGAAVQVQCAGDAVPAFGAAASVVTLSIADGRAALVLDGVSLAACALDRVARGAWGVAALGGAAAIESVTVARGQLR